MQTRIITPLAIVFALAFAAGAQAAPSTKEAAADKPLTAQQLRMRNCNSEAKAQSLKGDERRAFMSTCLKGGSTGLAAAHDDDDKPATPSAAQLKRKACNAEAKEKGLKGDERKAFVRGCVRDEAVAAAD